MSFITDRDLEYMQMALDQARLAPALGEVPIAAVIVMEGRILSQVHNFREVWQDPTAHAEVIAIREAAKHLGTWRLTGTTMYVTIEPCSMCAGAIIQSRVTRLVFFVHVGFDLDDAAGALTVHEVQAEQFGRDLEARPREERARQPRHQPVVAGGARSRRALSTRSSTACTRPSAASASYSPCATRRYESRSSAPCNRR